jgi:hypothetical protein
LHEATRILLCAVAGGFLAACSSPVDVLQEFDASAALSMVEEQMAFGPRYPGSAGHLAVQDWIESSLSDSGWQVELQDFTFDGVALRNIVGDLESDGGGLVVLGAHYDTRPVADRDPSQAGEPVPGANDGASGVAVLLELARLLPSMRLRCDVQLAFFDAEDSGRIAGWEWSLGSHHFVDQLSIAPEAAVIVDMVGDRDLRLPRELNSTPELVDAIWAAAQAAGSGAFVDEPGPSLIDDHMPFIERGWPAVDIIDFDYPYWHTPQDTADKIAAESLGQVGRALAAWLQSTCEE